MSNIAAILASMFSPSSPYSYTGGGPGGGRVVAINSSGQMVNQNGTALQLRGANMGMDSNIYSNQPASQQVWAGTGIGGPPWPTYQTWNPNVVRLTLNASAWLNVAVGVFTTTSTATAPAWSSSIPADPNGVYKNGVLQAFQWARKSGCALYIDCHMSAPTFTFGGTTYFAGAYGQPPFLDGDCALQFWIAGYGAGPGTTDLAGYPSSGIVAQISNWFGAPGFSAGNGSSAGQYYDPTIGGTTGYGDFIFEIFNEPYLTNQSWNFNTVSGGGGTSLTAQQTMLNGGYCSGFYNNGAGPGQMGTPGNNAGTQVGIPGVVYSSGQITSIVGNGTTVTVTIAANYGNSIAVGQYIQIVGVTTTTGYNGTWLLTGSTLGTNLVMTYSSAVTGTATTSSAVVCSGVLGPSGVAGTTGNDFVFNQWWRVAGYQQALNGIRALGATNVIMCNGLGYASTFHDAYQWFPTDTLTPRQVGIGFHPYQYSTSGFPQSLDTGVGTAFQLQYYEAYIAGNASYTVNGTGYTGLGFPVPIVASEFGDYGGVGYSTPATYTQSMTQWADGGTDSHTSTPFVGTFGCMPWLWTYVLASSASAGQNFYMNYFSAGVTISAYTTSTQQSGYPKGTGTIVVTNANGNTITPGAVITSGATDLQPFIGPQISGTTGGAGTYVFSSSTAQGNSGAPASFTIKYYTPTTGEGQTYYNWIQPHP